MIDPANTSESEHRYYEQLYYDRLERDAKLCRELRAFLQLCKGESGIYNYHSTHISPPTSDDANAIRLILIAIRDGGAK